MTDEHPSSSRRRKFIKLLAIAALLIAFMAGCPAWMMSMPGKSWSDPLPPLDARQAATSAQLRRDVELLAGTIGERNLFKLSKLNEAAAFLESRFKEIGFTAVRQAVPAKMGTGHNLEVEIRGATRPEEIVIVGAHY